MTKKLIVLLTLFYTVSIVTSCFDKCDKYIYYDFDKISIHIFTSIVPLDDSLILRIDSPDKRFVSFEKTQINLMNTANAQIDCDEGSGGMKFPIVKVEVSSDSDFSNGMLANSSLNEIVFVMDSGNKLVNIDDMNDRDDSWAYLYIKERPVLNKVHKISVKLFKSNGDIVSGTSDAIEWK